MITLLMILLSRNRSKRLKKQGIKQKAMSTAKFAFKLKICLAIDGFLLLVLIATIIIMSSFGIFDNMRAMIGANVALEDYTIPDEEQNKAEWDFGTTNKDHSSSGGLVAVDRNIRFRQELLQCIDESIEAAVAMGNNKIEPAYLLGTICRETGTSIYTAFEKSSINSLFDELIVENPVCRHSNCDWMAKGHSHFVGGSVVNKKDTGDPYTQILDFHMDSYKTYNGPNRKDHAVGWVQMETPYTYPSHFRYIYKETSPTFTGINTSTPYSQVEALMVNDANLGFIRPNICYIPDVIYNGVISNSYPVSTNTTAYSNMINKISSLDEKNQNFIKFVVRAWEYGVGNTTDFPYSQVDLMIELVNSKKVTYLGDMLKSDDISHYWSQDTMAPRRGANEAITYLQNQYGLGIGYSGKSALWFGLVYGCIGEIAYEQMNLIIDSAEKEATGSGAVSGEWGSQEYLYNIALRELNWFNEGSFTDKERKNRATVKYNDWSGKVSSVGSGGNKYGFGNKHAWCAMFCAYVWHNSGILEDPTLFSFGTTSGWENSGNPDPKNKAYKPNMNVTTHFKSEINSGSYLPQLGDVVVFYNKSGGTQHVGICISYTGEKSNTILVTIEGNTGTAGALGESNIQTEANASCVMMKSRKMVGSVLNINSLVSYDWTLGGGEYEPVPDP